LPSAYPISDITLRYESDGTSTSQGSRITDLLDRLYPPLVARDTAQQLEDLLNRHQASCPPPTTARTLSEQDALLITYADHVQEPGTSPLRTLATFCNRRQWGQL